MTGRERGAVAEKSLLHDKHWALGMRKNLVTHAAERELAQGAQATATHHEQIGFRLRRIANDFVGRAPVQQHDLIIDAGICQNPCCILDNLA